MAHPYATRPVAETHVWLTPPKIIKALGPFDLDPCAAPEPRPWDVAKRHITLPENGLISVWEGFVWLNPPFGPFAAPWMEKMAGHNSGIALLFARTETQMFFRHVWPIASAVFFLEGRPNFFYPDGTEAGGNSGGPIMLIGYGEEAARRLEETRLPGKFMRLK